MKFGHRRVNIDPPDDDHSKYLALGDAVDDAETGEGDKGGCLEIMEIMEIFEIYA